MDPMPTEMLQHYGLGIEADRLNQHAGPLERERTQELLGRYLPPPPATILDVGGGAAAHAFPLASLGYTVHLLDPVPLHVKQALESSRRSVRPLAGAAVGDARELAWPVLAVEGVGWLLPALEAELADAKRKERLLGYLRQVEREPSLLGTSAHLIAIGAA